MASVLQFFLVCAFFANLSHVQGVKSAHDADLLLKLVNAVNKRVSKVCYGAFTTKTNTLDTDTKVDQFCDAVKTAGVGGFKGCEQNDYDAIKKVTCEMVMKSADKRGKVLKAYATLRAAASPACQKELPTNVGMTTWLNIETLCKNMKVDKKGYADCKAKNEFDGVKDVVCAGTSKIVSGLGAILMSLVISLFNKM